MFQTIIALTILLVCIMTIICCFEMAVAVSLIATCSTSFKEYTIVPQTLAADICMNPSANIPQFIPPGDTRDIIEFYATCTSNPTVFKLPLSELLVNATIASNRIIKGKTISLT